MATDRAELAAAALAGNRFSQTPEEYLHELEELIVAGWARWEIERRFGDCRSEDEQAAIRRGRARRQDAA
jgi:hypothetical protein